jgi:hypothetical protein
MAHSLRSKSKLKAKSAKRGNEFQKAVDERTQRLHAKARQHLLKQKEESKLKALEEGKEVKEDVAEEDAMKDDEEAKKVSTSGYRTARHHLWKKKNRKNSHTAFQFHKK